MAVTWFVSHPSGSRQHTPTFFFALEDWQQRHPGIQLLLPHGAREAARLTQPDIAAADRIIVEASLASTGSGIELGWASSAQKPITVFHQAGTPLSPALTFVTTDIHPYVVEADIVQVLDTLSSG